MNEENSLAARVGERLRQVRKDRGFTLSVLAAESGVSVSYLSAVEKGVNHPSLRTLAAITQALKVSIPDVLAQEGQETLRHSRMPQEASGVAEISHPLLTLRSSIVAALPGEHGACPVPLDGRNLFVYVVRGTVEIHVRGAEYTLSAGDALDVAEPGEASWRSVAASTTTWVSCPAQ